MRTKPASTPADLHPMILILILIATLLAACGQVLTPTAPPPLVTEPLMTLPLATPALSPTVTPVFLIPTEPVSPTPSPTPIVHVVEPGDTLLGIAARHNVKLAAILQLNPGVRPEALQLGQLIAIPRDPASGDDVGLLPTPTPLPLPISGLGFYQTPAGGLWVLGEVVNQSDQVIANVQVGITLFDQDGEPLMAVDALGARDWAPPGEAVPFGALFQPPTDAVRNHRVVLLSAETVTREGPWHPHLVVARHQGGPAGAVFRVTGSVLNNGADAADQVAVLVTLLDTSGKVTGFAQHALPGSLSGGASETFDVRLSPAGPGTERYTVVATGRRVDSRP